MTSSFPLAAWVRLRQDGSRRRTDLVGANLNDDVAAAREARRRKRSRRRSQQPDDS